MLRGEARRGRSDRRREVQVCGFAACLRQHALRAAARRRLLPQDAGRDWGLRGVGAVQKGVISGGCFSAAGPSAWCGSARRAASPVCASGLADGAAGGGVSVGALHPEGLETCKA